MDQLRKIILLIFLPLLSIAQQDPKIPKYYINKPVDYTICAAGIAGTGIGAYLRTHKDPSDSIEIALLNPDDFNKIDRHFFDEGYNKNIDLASNLLFSIGFLAPVSLLLNDKINDHTEDFLTLYLETMAITGGLYWMTVGLKDKFRPYAYHPDISIGKRRSNNARNSFYAGHIAVVAAGSFFTAKVFDDYSDNISLTLATYAFATGITLAGSYYRLQGGYHFVDDVVVGILAGSLTGILVPELHKLRNNGGFSINPMIGPENGLHIAYKF